MAKFDTSRPNYVKTTNLGDSGYLILHPSGEEGGKFKKVFRSSEQQRDFNFPYQCGTGHENETFDAEDAAHEVQDKDIILMFSDGISDNMYDAGLAKCVRPYLDGQDFTNPQACADCIADKAYELGKSQSYLSPFAKHARAAGRNYPEVGKPDDISVICAQIHIG